MIVSGAGGYVTITKGATDALEAPYALDAWAEDTAYKRDDQVLTVSSDGHTQTKYWVAKDDHRSKTGDETGEATTTAGVLTSTHWEEIDAGELVELIGWSETRPVESTRGTLLLREKSPRTTNRAGAVTLELEFADNWESSQTQRALGVVDQRLYVRLYPKGQGSGLEQRHGYMKVGEFSGDGNQEDDLANSVTLTSDGDWTIEAQS